MKPETQWDKRHDLRPGFWERVNTWLDDHTEWVFFGLGSAIVLVEVLVWLTGCI